MVLCPPLSGIFCVLRLASFQASSGPFISLSISHGRFSNPGLRPPPFPFLSVQKSAHSSFSFPSQGLLARSFPSPGKSLRIISLPCTMVRQSERARGSERVRQQFSITSPAPRLPRTVACPVTDCPALSLRAPIKHQIDSLRTFRHAGFATLPLPCLLSSPGVTRFVSVGRSGVSLLITRVPWSPFSHYLIPPLPLPLNSLLISLCLESVGTIYHFLCLPICADRGTTARVNEELRLAVDPISLFDCL